jgi:hypothetical protein
VIPLYLKANQTGLSNSISEIVSIRSSVNSACWYNRFDDLFNIYSFCVVINTQHDVKKFHQNRSPLSVAQEKLYNP